MTDPFFNPVSSRRDVHMARVASRVMTVYRRLRTFETLPSAGQDKWLAGRLTQLLTHARGTSQFWREWLPEPTAAKGQCNEILAEIPPLSRGVIQAESERLIARFSKKASLGPVWTSTSGSTGTPVRVQHLRNLYMPVYFAVTLLLKDWYGFDPSKPVGWVGSKYKDRDRVRLGLPFRWVGSTGFGFQASVRDHQTPDLYDYCAQRNPGYLLCGPGIVVELARYALKAGRHDLRPEAVLTLGSAVTGEMRQTVREGLGARIIDRYSCEEAGYIALQCPKHDHFHVVTPMTIVEIVDEEGKQCPPGKPGRVLLTSLQSYGMPLIRYEIGDRAEWGEPCDCGITLPVLKQIWGRTRHLVTHPDGRQTFVVIYARDFEDLPDLEAYRFVLHQGAIIVAQLKLRSPSTQIEAIVTERLHRVLGYPYPVRFSYVDAIDWGSSWKQENFGVSDAPPPEPKQEMNVSH